MRRTPDEGLAFLGRRDRMVKRRGYRVELGEIEASFSLHPDISDCAVIAQPDAETGVRIVAVTVMKEGAKPSLVALKQHTAARPALHGSGRFVFRDHTANTR